MSWRLLGRYNPQEHLTAYLLATASNLFISIPLYTAARAGAIGLLSPGGSTGRFISEYGISWGITVDFFWTLLVFQGLLAILVLTIAGTSLIEKGWRGLYAFLGLVTAGFVGYWLGARFLQTLDWVSLLQNSGIDSRGVYSDLFWYGLGATIFYVGMILVLRRSYNRISELRNSGKVQVRSATSLPS